VTKIKSALIVNVIQKVVKNPSKCNENPNIGRKNKACAYLKKEVVKNYKKM